MFKKKVKYTDFLGESREEELRFHLTRTEVLEMNFRRNGALSQQIEAIIAAKSLPEIYDLFKRIVLSSYGEISEDGRHFMKSEEISHKFECSAAYDALMRELTTNEDAAADFISHVIPEKVDLPDIKPAEA